MSDAQRPYMAVAVDEIATFFFLAWLLARDNLSRTARLVGWLSVAVSLGGKRWSLWFETLEPYLRTGRFASAYLSILQLVVAAAGMVIVVAGAVRFLRAWGQHGMDHLLDAGLPGRLPRIQPHPVSAQRPYPLEDGYTRCA